MAQLNINRGTTYTIAYRHNRNGAPSSLAGATVRFTIKDKEFDNDMSDTSAPVVKNITTGTVGGEATIVIEPTDTATLKPGRWYYDIKVREADGTVYKTDEGTIRLDGSPTNRLS